MSLNIRNSKLTRPSMLFLSKSLQSHETLLTGLCLKYCFLTFEQILELSNGIRSTKNLVKLDISNNGLKPAVIKFLLHAL
jgi:hypothetical protein